MNLTGRQMADNDRRSQPNDAGIGQNGTELPTCLAIPGQCNDDQACLCDMNLGLSPNLDHFLEFTVACQEGELVDPEKLSLRAQVTESTRPTDISVYVNTQPGAYAQFVDVGGDSPISVTDQTQFNSFDVDLSGLDPTAWDLPQETRQPTPPALLG